MTGRAAALACPACREPLVEEVCARCGTRSPRVGAVTVAALGAEARIRAAVASVQASRRSLPASLAAPGRSDAADVLAARRANAELLERCLAPAEAWIAEPAPLRLADLVAGLSAGWSPERLLPWFVFDWGGTDAFRAQSADLLALLGRHAHSRDTALVLGCGAAGLVAALARSFGTVLGGDLSLASLLLARRLLDGEELAVHLPEAGFRRATLRGAAPPVENATLAALDAADLPLADGSVDLVTAAYLLDVVPDAGALLAEANRVLAEGGLLVTVGPPFRPRQDPYALGPRRLPDVAPFLEGLGFEPLALEPRAFTLLDLSAVDPALGGTRKPVQLLVARKRRALPPDAPRDAFVRHARGEREAALALVPRLAPEARFHALAGTAFEAAGVRRACEIRLEAPGRTEIVPVSPALLRVLEPFWEGLDGRRSAVEALALTRQRSGFAIEESDYVATLRLLADLGAISFA